MVFIVDIPADRDAEAMEEAIRSADQNHHGGIQRSTLVSAIPMTVGGQNVIRCFLDDSAAHRIQPGDTIFAGRGTRQAR